MFSYIWPIALVVLSNTLYQITAKSVPEGMTPLASLTVPYLIAPAHVNRQRAASTAVRAAQIYAERADAALVSADDFRPEYLRIPQAERERGDKRNYKVFV